MTPSFAETVETVRRTLRRHDRDSIFYAALAVLQRHTSDRLADLQTFPWLIALLVKWACLDGVMPRRERPPIEPPTLAGLAQRLWEATDHTMPNEPERSLRLMMRRQLNAQLPFQRYQPSSFILVPALLAHLDETHTLRRLFREQVGMDEETFMDLSLFFAAAVQRGTLNIDLAHFDSTLSYPPETIAAFLRFISRTPNGLVGAFRDTEDPTTRRLSELLEFPALARYPFLREGTTYRCWNPMLYHHGIPAAVHHALTSARGGDYVARYGQVLEAHVVRLARAAGGRWVGERELRSMLPPKSEVAEGLLSFDGVNVSIESKAGRFPEASVTAGRRDIVANQTRAVAKAIEQGWATSEGLRAHGTAPAAIRDAEREYHLVVTSRELLIGTARQLADTYPEHKLVAPSTAIEQRLPLEHVFVMSIDDYEWLMEAARLGKLDLPTFLDACASRNANPADAAFLIDQHLERTVGDRIQSTTVSDARAAARARLEAAVHGQA